MNTYSTDYEFMRNVHRKVVATALQEMIDNCYAQVQLLDDKDKGGRKL